MPTPEELAREAARNAVRAHAEQVRQSEAQAMAAARDAAASQRESNYVESLLPPEGGDSSDKAREARQAAYEQWMQTGAVPPEQDKDAQRLQLEKEVAQRQAMEAARTDPRRLEAAGRAAWSATSRDGVLGLARSAGLGPAMDNFVDTIIPGASQGMRAFADPELIAQFQQRRDRDGVHAATQWFSDQLMNRAAAAAAEGDEKVDGPDDGKGAVDPSSLVGGQHIGRAGRGRGGAGGAGGAAGAVQASLPGAPGTERMDAVADRAAALGLAVGDQARDAAQQQAQALMDGADRADAIDLEWRQREQELREAQDQALRNLQSSYQNLQARQVDPDRWWSTKSSGAKVTGALALAMSAFAGAVRGDGQVRALQRIQDEIAQDLDIQERDLARAERVDQAKLRGNEQILAHFAEQLGDVPAARDAAQAAALRAQANRARAAAAGIEDAERQHAFMRLALELEARAAERDHAAQTQMAQIGMSAALRARRGGGGGGGGSRGPSAVDRRWAAGQIKGYPAALDAIDQVRAALARNGDAGLGVGWRAIDAVGLGGVAEAVDAVASDGTAVANRQAIGNAFAQFIRALSGAQAAEAEVARLQAISQGPMTPESVQEGMRLMESAIEKEVARVRGGAPEAFDAVDQDSGLGLRNRLAGGGPAQGPPSSFRPAGGGR